MKAYTDIEQSKKLAEILPHESADMFWKHVECKFPKINFWKVETIQRNFKPYSIDIPCWSLAALLNALPVSVDEGQHCLALINSNPNGDIEWLCCYEDDNGNILMECYGDNQIDACIEMIYKLKEKDLT